MAVRARRRRSRDWRRRRRRRRTGLPLPCGRTLRRRSRAPVGGEPLERIPVHVDLRETAGDQLIAEVLSARKPDIREEASVAIARVLGRVAAEDNLLRHRQLSRTRGGLGEVADTSFGRVDADQPDPLGLAARQPDVERVSVDDVRHRAAVGERAAGDCRALGTPCSDRRQRSQGEQQTRGKFYACCGRLAPLWERGSSRRTRSAVAPGRRTRPRSRPSPRAPRPRSTSCAR